MNSPDPCAATRASRMEFYDELTPALTAMVLRLQIQDHWRCVGDLRRWTLGLAI